MGDLLKVATDRDRMHQRRALERAARYARKLAKARDAVSIGMCEAMAGIAESDWSTTRQRQEQAGALRRAVRGALEHVARWCEREARQLPRCP